LSTVQCLAIFLFRFSSAVCSRLLSIAKDLSRYSE